MDIPGTSNSPPDGEVQKVSKETLCTRMDELATSEDQKTTTLPENIYDMHGGLEPEAETDESFREFEPENNEEQTIEPADVAETPAEPPKKRRGRPPKSKNGETKPTPKRAPKKAASPQKRPRKPRKKKEVDSDDDEALYRLIDEEMGPSRKKKKESVSEPVLEETTTVTPKKRRGRPPRNSLLDSDMPLPLATPKPAKKPGKRGTRRSRNVNSSDDSDADDELKRIPTRLTADMLRTIDHFHHMIETLPESGCPGITPGLAYLPFSEIYRVYHGKTDPGYEVITFPNESTIFT